MSIPNPRWLNSLKGEARDKARYFLVMKTVAMLLSPGAKFITLYEALGWSENYFYNRIKRGPWIITGDECVKIEKLCGREYLRREDIRPDLFVIAE